MHMDHPALYTLPDQPGTNVDPISRGSGNASPKLDLIDRLNRVFRRLRTMAAAEAALGRSQPTHSA